MNVLAIGAHPDDLETLCAGTLAKCVKRGDTVTMVHVGVGDAGHKVIPAKELIEMRAGEARAAGAMIGAEVVSLGERDLFIRSDNLATRDKIVDEIRRTQPDFIITHNPDDYMDDHNETSKLVYEATMAATVVHHETKYPAYMRLCPIFYMEPVAGINSFPEYFVDISDVIETKIGMLAQHKSQLVWLRDHDGIDILEKVRLMSAFRGYQCEVDYAEGFTCMKQFHKIPVQRFLP